MLFLGIRLAVRRGVTITLLTEESEQSPLPFNLASLIPIRMDEGAEGISKALTSGFVCPHGPARWLSGPPSI